MLQFSRIEKSERRGIDLFPAYWWKVKEQVSGTFLNGIQKTLVKNLSEII